MNNLYKLNDILLYTSAFKATSIIYVAKIPTFEGECYEGMTITVNECSFSNTLPLNSLSELGLIKLLGNKEIPQQMDIMNLTDEYLEYFI